MRQDLRQAVRQLVASPGFCLAVLCTLALSIGVNTAVFSILDGFFIRQLPYPQPDRIASLVIHIEGPNRKTGALQSEEDNSFDGASWELLNQQLDSLIFASWGGTGGVNLQTGDGAARYVQGARVSAHYFEVLGVPLLLGRSFTVEEDRPHGPAAAILSYALWSSSFQEDRRVIGKTIRLKGEPYTVAGVLPPNTITPSGAAVFTPLKPATTGECGGQNCGILVRLKPGKTWQQLNTQLVRVALPLLDSPIQHGLRAWLYARPMQAEIAAEVNGKVQTLMLVVVFILLIACANLAGLNLVRMSRREPEIATRLALGASPWRVIRQFWTENLLLAFAGGLAGVACANLFVGFFQRNLPEWALPMGGLSLDRNVLCFAAGVTLFTSLLFGALPALQTRAVDLRTSIASGSRTLARGSGRLRQFLIAGEVALTLVMLAASGLMVRTLLYLQTQTPGFDPQHVITAKASLDDARYHDANAFHSLLSRSIAALREIPGVQQAAVALSVPYERGLNDSFKLLEGDSAGTRQMTSTTYVTPGFFAALRIQRLAGRLLTETDTPESQLVAVVNQSFSRRFFHEPAAVGHQILFGKTRFTIVGVVPDVAKRPGLQGSSPLGTEPMLYLPATQMDQSEINGAHLWFQPSWIVRTNLHDQSAVIRQMQSAMASVDPLLPFASFATMDQILQQELQKQRLEVFLLTTLAALALLLSAIGTYALVSSLVVQRKREIGIRLALGSTYWQAMRHTGYSGVLPALCGVAGGGVLSFGALRVLASEIYGVRLIDPVTLISVPLLLVAIAGLASFLPTLKIVRLHPAETLRAE